METKTVKLDMGEVTITFFDAFGEPLMAGKEARANRFIIEGPGIDSRLVKRVVLPTLDYSKPDLLTVQVEMYTGLDIEVVKPVLMVATLAPLDLGEICPDCGKGNVYQYAENYVRCPKCSRIFPRKGA